MTSRRNPLRGYVALSRAITLIGPIHLRRRLAKGKELPDRWREKLGEPTEPRPDGPLVWLHAVGLGEVLALRGLIAAMAEQSDARFLVTSTTRGSAQVFAANLPPRTTHQFLPLDAPRYLNRFLDHWRPALSIWAEQDLWPGAVAATDARGIPLALVNARMNAEATARRLRYKTLFADLLSRFQVITAQDEGTAHNLQALGAKGVRVTGSLKSAAPPLTADPQALSAAKAALGGRRPVLLASSHPDDEGIAFAALRDTQTRPLLIVAPRDPHGRGTDVAARAAGHGLTATHRSAEQGPTADVWIADTFGEMGLWYRLCPVTLIGGSFGPTEGHNPWEPAALGSAILHGPHIANFAADFAALHGAGAAQPVSPETLVAALAADHSAMATRAKALSDLAKGSLRPLAAQLLDLAGLR